jgi:hypothetical protein
VEGKQQKIVRDLLNGNIRKHFSGRGKELFDIVFYFLSEMHKE